MTDRELFELAAKAIGKPVDFNDYGVPGYWDDWRGLPLWESWNPLDDDGDAMRLAVELDIDVFSGVNMRYAESDFGPFSELVTEGWDKYAATRRAIVRAAAEIGKRKKESEEVND